jgi:hypothetical protein
MRLTVRWLKNHHLQIVHRNGRKVWKRHEGPEGFVTMREAAKALGTYHELIRRLVNAGRLQVSNRTDAPIPPSRRPRFVAMRDVLKLRRAWKRVGPTTRIIRGSK